MLQPTPIPTTLSLATPTVTDWITVVLLAGALVAYLLQFRALHSQVNVLRDQLNTMRESSHKQISLLQTQLQLSETSAKYQNLLTLISFIQDQDVRDARAKVTDELSRKAFATWDQEDKRAASMVAANYDVAAIILRSGAVLLEPILKSWGKSIRLCHEALEGYMTDRKPQYGHDWWEAFDWLYAKAKEKVTP